MPDELTDGQIALPCEIGELHLPELMDVQKRALERLVSQGYVKAAENHASSAFTLTSKGAVFLGKRGAGLNEA